MTPGRLVRDAPEEETAYAFVDWMLAPEAQLCLSRALLCGTVNKRAAELLDAEVSVLLPHERLEQRFADGPYLGLPPRHEGGGLATIDEWHRAWERVRAA